MQKHELASRPREKIIAKITLGETFNLQIRDSFPAEQITDPDNYTGYLFYFGLLSVTGVRHDMPVLEIPNNNVRAQYYRYLQKKLMVGMQSKLSYVPIAELSEGFREAAFNGNVRPVLETAVRQCSLNSSCRQLISCECLFQAYLLAYLALNDIGYVQEKC